MTPAVEIDADAAERERILADRLIGAGLTVQEYEQWFEDWSNQHRHGLQANALA